MIPSKHEFDKIINDILNRNEYRHLNNSLNDLLIKVKEGIASWIFNRLKDVNWTVAPVLPEKLAVFLIILGIIFIIAVIISVIVMINKGVDRSRKIRTILGEKIEQGSTPETLRKKALNFAKKENFRLAIRYNFIALLFLLHEKRVLYLDQTSTNFEICRCLERNNFSGIGIFTELVDLFNSSWYGHQESSREVYENWLARLNQLWNEVISHGKKNK